ncbi:MAG: hypothetical protein Q8S53_06885, partial [Brevundimonas sp.]|uniref:hypothetical protein n=1 Tax=Brevundimonas sp. TaxID=1871086 RepID=UPI002732F539
MTAVNIAPEEWWRRHQRVAIAAGRRAQEACDAGDMVGALTSVITEAVTIAVVTMVIADGMTQAEAAEIELGERESWDILDPAVARVAAMGAAAPLALSASAAVLESAREIRDRLASFSPSGAAQNLAGLVFFGGRLATATELLRTLHEGLWRDAAGYHEHLSGLSLGGQVRAQGQKQAAESMRKEALRLALLEIEKTPRVTENRGDLTVLAEEVSGAWTMAGKKP